MIHVAIAGQRDGLNQSQNSHHVRHGQLLIHGALTLRFPNEGHCYGYENREKPLHLLSRSKFDFQSHHQTGVSSATARDDPENSPQLFERLWKPSDEEVRYYQMTF